MLAEGAFIHAPLPFGAMQLCFMCGAAPLYVRRGVALCGRSRRRAAFTALSRALHAPGGVG